MLDDNEIEIYKEILEGKRNRFPKNFWKNNKRKKAKILFKYLFEEVLQWNVEKLIRDFNYKTVHKYKLITPFEFFNRGVVNVIKEVYPNTLSIQRLPTTKETREKISVAQKNLSKEKRERITKGRIKLNDNKEYIKKLSDTKLGELNPSHKLKANEVRKIKKLWLTGNYSTTKLGEKFGVKRQTITDIVYGRTWKHI